MSNVFDIEVLVEKLSKLNSSQHSIESLSRWCISHQRKSKQIVETWEKLFNSSQKEQCISFLYLANDILQNSRRKGNEFVNEFWKVLPSALRHIFTNGDDSGKKAATRIVDIWEQRKVFGSRGQSLRDEMLDKIPDLLARNSNNSNLIKIVKKDDHCVRIKLAAGGLAEKVLTAFQTVLDDNFNKETTLNESNAAVHQLNAIVEDVEIAASQGNQQKVSSLLDEVHQQEQVLQQCVRTLKSAEATRAILVCQLKEALEEQESELELIRSQLQVARGQMDQVNGRRTRLISPSLPVLSTSTSTISAAEATNTIDQNHPSGTAVPFAPKTTEEENTKAAAAAMAEKLAASASSVQMLTSVLSSLVAEEAALKNSISQSHGYPSFFPPEKRQKLEKPIPVSDAELGNSGYSTQPLTNMHPAASQCIQSTAGMMVGAMPYGYGTSTISHPPSVMQHMSMNLGMPSSQQQQQQQPTTGGFYRPPGIGFYGQSHQTSTPPVPRN